MGFETFDKAVDAWKNERVAEMQSDLKARQERIAALEAENKRLVKALNAIVVIVDTDLNEAWYTNLNATIKQLLDDEAEIKAIAREALQPAKEQS